MIQMMARNDSGVSGYPGCCEPQATPGVGNLMGIFDSLGGLIPGVPADKARIAGLIVAGLLAFWFFKRR